MSTPFPLQSPPKKICILRLSALGDVTHVIPLIRRIQRQWPACEITWVCGTIEYKFLKIIEGVRFILFNKKVGYKEYLKLKKQLQNEHFDILLHMQVAARSNLASLCIKADVRLGWDRARSRDLHHLFVNHTVVASTRQHQQDGFLSFGDKLGLDQSTTDWLLPVTKNAEHFVETQVTDTRPLLVISACSSHKLRNWNAEGYAAVADYAIDTHAMQVVLSGGPSPVEKQMSDAIIANMKNRALNIVGADTLEQLVGLLDRARIVLSPDSGPGHIANAVGTTVVGLYACTSSKRSGPYHSLPFCVDKYEEAAKIYKGKSASELAWGTKIELPGVMDMITVEEVCEKLDNALQRT